MSFIDFVLLVILAVLVGCLIWTGLKAFGNDGDD